jgi:dinuclear metal center YbgI/SA1388 family protein
MKKTHLVKYLNQLLHIGEIEDSSQNGLQVDGAEEISRVAFAVDACQASFAAAAAKGAQLLMVHHGLFWGKPLILTGAHYRRIKTLLNANIALYAAHLPLDCHPQVGNNAELARVLGLKKRRPFGCYHKRLLGFSGELSQPAHLRRLAARLAQASGVPVVRVLDNGPKLVRQVGCVSGGAADMMGQAAEAGLDVYVTGEATHRAFHEAAELRLNVIFGGHYATETFGLKAVARALEKKFGLETVFLDLPTGW